MSNEYELFLGYVILRMARIAMKITNGWARALNIETIIYSDAQASEIL